MSLTQISEPDKNISQDRISIGIDLGTTNSLIAFSHKGQVELLKVDDENYILPSVISFNKEGNMIFGNSALSNQFNDPLNTLTSIKRLIGKDISALSDSRYDIITNTNGILEINTRYGSFSPIQLSSQILYHLKKIAENKLGKNIFGAVITVPAYFDDAQRQATRDAAYMAGLNVLRLLNEPTAAAIAYGIENSKEGFYAVYDLGGGTFDLSILNLTKGVFEVIVTKGDTSLGGDDFDELLADALLEMHDIKNITLESRCKLLFLAKKAKESLSVNNFFEFEINLNDVKFNKTIYRNWFNKITQHLVIRTMDCVKRALFEAKLDVKDISGIVMVGGSTRMPMIFNAIKEFFHKDPLININPDQVVAIGAALQAELLSGNQNNKWLLLDVSPLTLGIETFGGLVECIIPRNSKIPVFRSQEFTTFRDGQKSIEIHVVQGERDLVKDCRSLAKFVLSGIPPMPAGMVRIIVTFQIDADGILNVIAKEKTTGNKASISVKPSHGLTSNDISNMLLDGIKNKELDMNVKLILNSKNELRKLLNSISDSMILDNYILREHEKNEIINSINSSKKVLENSNELIDLEKAKLELINVSKDFFIKRLNYSIKNSLISMDIDKNN